MSNFKPNFLSLQNYKVPDWFKDAKFGIWAHWSASCVAEVGDWYARKIYMQGTNEYDHHYRVFGHPSKHGYKDVAKLWKAEKFTQKQADKLMKLYSDTGAKYFVSMGMHHDAFFNYPSKLHSFNSVNIGPKKNIALMWKKAAQKFGLKFGLSEHLGASFTWWRVNKGSDKVGKYKGVPYDGSNKKYKDIYWDKSCGEQIDKLPLEELAWYTHNVSQQRYWNKCIKEMIDLLSPDLIYTDGTLPFGEDRPIDHPSWKYGLDLLAYYYNNVSNSVYTQKRFSKPFDKISIRDVERGMFQKIQKIPFQTDTCFGEWFYDNRRKYKQPGHIIEMLINVVSLNGCLLLNVIQKPDGTLDEEIEWNVMEIKKWMSDYKNAIHGTIPYTMPGEGPTKIGTNKAFGENRAEWKYNDFRFTQNKEKTIVNVFIMKPSDKTLTIKSIKNPKCVYHKNEKLPLKVLKNGFQTKLPLNKINTDYPVCIQVKI